MKRLFITASFILAFIVNGYAQEDHKDTNIITYSCDDTIKQDLKKETITLVGNAKLKTGIFEFLNAEKIVINKISNEIIVTGKFKVNMNGGTIQKAAILEKNQLRYVIGENVAYVE